MADQSVNSAAGRAAAAQAAAQANKEAGERFQKASTPQTPGSGFGAGRITFDPSGNRLVDNKIANFASTSTYNQYLGERGLSNKGTITDQAKFERADFSQIPGYEAGQVSVAKEEKPVTFRETMAQEANKDVTIFSTGKEVYRNSPSEDRLKQTEAERAGKFYPSFAKTGYQSGGTKKETSVITLGKAQSFFGDKPSFGWKDVSTSQLARGSGREEQAKQSEVARTSKTFPSAVKVGYEPTKTPNPFISTPSVSKPTPVSAASPAPEPSTMSDKQFRSIISSGVKQDALFLFVVGEKQVGQTSGARTYHDYLEAKKSYGENVAVVITYPQREKALTDSLQKNPGAFASLPGNYWSNLGKTGYVSKNNVGKVNDILALNYEIKGRENLSSLQGALFSELHGGPIPTEKGTVIVGPQEHEVSSFLKFPFAGQKESTSLVPSTSYANVLQFAPGLGNKEMALATRGLGSLVDKAAPKLAGFKNAASSGIRETLATKVLFETPFLNTPRNFKDLPVSGDVGVRNRPTYRATNMMREKLPSDILQGSHEQGPKPISERQPTPRNTFLEDVSMETQAKLSGVQKGLLKPRTEPVNPPASPIIPFFKGRISPSGKEFTANEPPVKKKPTASNESASVFGKTASVAPVAVATKPDTGLSPLSREYFGVQFQGSYPTSYLPPAGGLISAKPEVRPPEDINPLRRRGNPPVKKNYPFSNPIDFQQTSRSEYVEQGNVKFSHEVFTSKGSKLSTLFGETKAFGALRPVGKEQPTKQLLPEEINPLGYRGKPPVKTSNVELPTSRAKVVEETTPTYFNEVFRSSGKKISPSIVFGETQQIGALGKTGKPIKEGKTINLEPQKDYQDWRFGKYLTETPLKFGVKLKETRTIDLEPRKDYQEWRFTKFSEKNPKQEPVGAKGIWKELDKSLPKQYGKASVFSGYFKETKGPKLISTSAKLIEKPKPEAKKSIEFKNLGSKSGTILLQKPLARKRVASTTEQQFDYNYEYKPVPTSKSDSSLIMGLRTGVLPKSLIKSNAKLELFSNRAKTSSKTQITPITSIMSKLSMGTSLKQTPTLSSILAIMPKQGTTPKQSTMLGSQMPTPQRPRQTEVPKLTQPQARIELLIIPPRKPPKTVVPSYFADLPIKRGSKRKEGPTALYKLDVKNIFASGLSIFEPRNKKYEF